MKNNVNYMEIADKVYKHVNPETKMCTPNSVYIATEKWYYEWSNDTETDLDLFEWILKFKK